MNTPFTLLKTGDSPHRTHCVNCSFASKKVPSGDPGCSMFTPLVVLHMHFLFIRTAVYLFPLSKGPLTSRTRMKAETILRPCSLQCHVTDLQVNCALNLMWCFYLVGSYAHNSIMQFPSSWHFGEKVPFISSSPFKVPESSEQQKLKVLLLRLWGLFRHNCFFPLCVSFETSCQVLSSCAPVLLSFNKGSVKSRIWIIEIISAVSITVRLTFL